MSQRISVRQIAYLQYTTIAPTMLILLPGEVLVGAGHDAPWTTILAGIAGLALDAALVTALGRSAPPRLFRRAWGPRAGTVLTVVYGMALSLGLVAIWAEFLILLRAEVLPLTPFVATAALVGAVAAVLVTGGASGIARVNDLVVPTTVLVVSGLVLAAALRVETWNWFPPYPLNVRDTVSTAWLPVTFLGELPVTAAFLPWVRRAAPRTVHRAMLAGVGAAALTLTASTMLTLGVLGAPLARRLLFPFFEVIADIRIGDFLTKNALWLIAVGSTLLYIKAGIWVYAIADTGRAAARFGARSWWGWAVTAMTLAIALAGFTRVDAGQRLVTVGWAEGAFPVILALVGGSWARDALRRRRA